MSFLLNNCRYTYRRAIQNSDTRYIHLVVDDHGKEWVAKISGDCHPEIIKDMGDEPGNRTTIEILEVEESVYQHIQKHLGTFPNIVDYIHSGVLPNDELPTEMQNSYNEPVMVIILSYIPGFTLLDMPSPINIEYVLRDVILAFMALQRINVSYLDLHTSNVMFDTSRSIFRLIDFGDAELYYSTNPMDTLDVLIAHSILEESTMLVKINNPDKLRAYHKAIRGLDMSTALDVLYKMYNI